MTKMMCSKSDDAIYNYHCKTQLRKKTFSYLWSIDDICEIQQFEIKCESGCTKNNFVFSMCPEQGKLKLYGMIKKARYNPTPCCYTISFETKRAIIFKTSGNCLMNHNRPELFDDPPISFFLDNQAEEYVLNGTLTIHFKLDILDELINSSINYSYKTSALTDRDSFVPNETSNSFVTFVVNKEQTLKANKSLLCSKSKVFKTMFDCGLEESKTNKIEITDIKYNTLKELLSFVETGYLSKEICPDVTCELFITANKYDIEDLQLKCEEYLINNVTKGNVVKYLKIAHLNNGTILGKYAKDFIKLYLKDIVDTPSFKSLMLEYPELLIQIKNIQLPTTDACDYLIKESHGTLMN